MDTETYDQHTIGGGLCSAIRANFLTENAEVEVTMYEEKPIGVQLPQKMVFEIVDTIDNPDHGQHRDQRDQGRDRSTPA